MEEICHLFCDEDGRIKRFTREYCVCSGEPFQYFTIIISILSNCICLLQGQPCQAISKPEGSDFPDNDFGESGPFFVLKSTATGACCQHMRELLVKLAKEIAQTQELWYTVSMRIYNSLRTMYWSKRTIASTP